jgi:hypothetical protein
MNTSTLRPVYFVGTSIPPFKSILLVFQAGGRVHLGGLKVFHRCEYRRVPYLSHGTVRPSWRARLRLHPLSNENMSVWIL